MLSRIRLFHLLICCLLLVATLVRAEGLIRGTVLAADTGSPLAGVNVTVPGSVRGTSTDIQGRFLLTHLPQGVYSLRFTHVGYADVRMDGIHTSVWEPQDLTVRMHSLVYHDSLTVVVPKPRITVERGRWRYHLNLAESASTAVINRLQEIPGVTIIGDEHSATGVRVSVDGCPPHRVTVRVDGVVQNPGNRESVDITLLGLQQLESVELSRTGTGAALGADLNFVTGSPSSRVRSSVTIDPLPGVHLQSDVSVGQHSAGFRILNSPGDWKYTDPSLGSERRERTNNDVRSLSGFWRSRLNQGDIRLQGMYRTGGVPPLIDDEGPHNIRRREGQIDSEVRLLHFVGSPRARVRFEQLEYQADSSGYQPWDSNERYTRHDVELEGRSESITLTSWWQDYRGEDILRRTHTGQQLLTTHLLYEHPSVHWQEHTEINWRLGGYLLTGPHNRLYPVGGISHTWFTGPLTWLSEVQTGVRLPSFLELAPIPGLMVTGNPDLKPERFVSIQSALIHTTDTRTTRLSLVARQAQDLIRWRRNSFEKWQAVNLARARLLQGSLTVEQQTTLWQDGFLQMHFLLNDARNVTPGHINRGNQLPLQPVWSGSGMVAGSFGKLSWSLQAEIAASRYVSDANTAPLSRGYRMIDPLFLLQLELGQRFRHLGWSLRVDNLLDRDVNRLERLPSPPRLFRFSLTSKF